MGVFHSQTATVFHLGSAIESLQMQMLPERKRCNTERTRAAKRRVIVSSRLCLFSVVTWHHQHFGDPLQTRSLPMEFDALSRKIRSEDCLKGFNSSKIFF